MRSTSVLARVAAVVGACAVGLPVAIVTTDSASASTPATPTLSRSGEPLAVTATVSGRPTALPSKPQQEQVLEAAYTRMVDDYSAFRVSGPNNIVDYGIGQLWRQGIDGAGTTIAVLEAWESPGIAKTVDRLDKYLGLPNPQITTIFPSGHHRLPGACPPAMVKVRGKYACAAWESEENLDVLSAHEMAPYAKIVVSVTPPDSEITDDAASQAAPPEIMQAVEAISHRRLADVISISGGTSESAYSDGPSEVTAQDPGELTAAAAGIPVTASTGDCGVVQDLPASQVQCGQTTRKPATATWDDSPWTLAVGGSVPNLSTTGQRLGPDPLWRQNGTNAAGAGFSSIFARPGYQSGVASITHSPMRSMPDITMDAEDGTSEAAPLMAGVLALATQANGGHDLGPVNTALYDVLGPHGAADGIADVVTGDNSVISRGGKVLVPGFAARRGFDVASGWGTIDAPRFVPALVRATRASHDERAVRAHATAALAVLRRAVHLSPARVTGAATSRLTAKGFLPRHPVALSIGGRRVTTLHADSLGDVRYTIDPARLHLADGTHIVTLTSMLITVSGRLTTG